MHSIQTLAVLGLFLTTLSGCVTDKVTGERSLSLANWSVEEEREKGAEAAPNVESQFDAIYPNREANEVLGRIVMDMASHSPRANDFDWQFKILNSSQVNAFALPGGFVYITRGLLQQMDSEGEFVFALGHEIGHVEHQHSMHNQSRATVAGVLTSPFRVAARIGDALPVGGGAVNLAAGIAIAPSALLLLNYNRSQESEADVRGVYFDVALGLDPRTAEQLFAMFEEMEREAGMDTPGWFRSHPLNEDRITDVREIIERDYPDAPAEKTRSSEFQALLEKMRADAPAYALYDQARAILAKEDPAPADLEVAEKKLTEAKAGLPGEPLIEVALGELAMFREHNEQARAHFESAVAIYERQVPGESFWKPHFYLGILYGQANDAAGAVKHLTQCTRLFPMNAVAWYFLGEARVQNGQRAEAKAAYERAVDLAPSGSPVGDQARDKARQL